MNSARPRLAWALFTVARVLLRLAGRAAGREVPLGPVAGQLAAAMKRVDRGSAMRPTG